MALIGRPTYLSAVGEEKLVDRVESATIHLKSVRQENAASNSLYKAIVAVKTEETSANSLAAAQPPSTSTLYRLKQKHFVAVQSKVKATPRQEAFEQLRTSLSLAACLEALWVTVTPELFFSSDDVSTLLNSWNNRPAVITTRKRAAIMKAMGLEVSTTSTDSPRVVLKLNITMNGLGRTVVKVMQFGDSNFQFDVKVRKMDDTGLYALLFGAGVSKSAIALQLYECCILPEVYAFRDKCIARDYAPTFSSIIQPSLPAEINGPLTAFDNMMLSSPSLSELARRLDLRWILPTRGDWQWVQPTRRIQR